MTLLAHRRAEHASLDEEALIPEARRLRRRRWGIGVFVAAMAAGAIAGGLVATSGRPPVPVLRAHFAINRSGPVPYVNTAAFAGAGELAFVSAGSLWVLNGTNRTLVAIPVPSGFVAESPTLSHDGRWVAFIATGKQMTGWTASTVVVARSNGTDAQRLTTFDLPEVSLIGWSSTRDALAYVTPNGDVDANPYLPPSGVEVWTPNGTSEIATFPEVEGGAWSPDGTRLAIMSDTDIPRQVQAWTASITVFPASGGAGVRWLRYRDTVRSVGTLQTQPTSPVAGGAGYLLPMGWWPKWGIGFVIIEGNPGSPFDSAVADGGGQPFATIASPTAKPRLLGAVMIDQAFGPISSSRNGELAFTQVASAQPFWSSQTAAIRCAIGATSCRALPAPTGSFGFEPTWSPDGSKLAYLVGKQGPGPESFDNSYVQAWYNNLTLNVASPTAGTIERLALGTGAVAPTWSPSGRDLLFVRNDDLWLWHNLREKPVEVAGPLFESHSLEPYYGQVRWSQQFVWTGDSGK